ncbi:vWA domain-containing protein [Pseudactinotalea sp. Z1739]|uniref:vWA domain-containing protein n=1 Tax=Pseudactinotalea sp. Z1739 TaxID=3413028 RepID=UPI003C7D1093
MTLRMMWPLWVTAIVFAPLLALTIWQSVRGRGQRRLHWLRRCGMVLALIAIALTPAVPSSQSTQVSSNAELFFVVDRTGSMAAEDYNGTQPRLEGVRHDLVALTEAMPGARYTIIGFDSQATRQLPLTTDSRAVRSWADTVNQEITTYSAGSAIDRPLEALGESLSAAAERNPANVRLVFFFSDGENTNEAEGGEVDSYAPLAELVDGGAVLGYGTPQGGNMRSYDGTANSGPGTDAPYIMDPATGEPAVSVIDEGQLRTLAADLGLAYDHRISPDGVDHLVSGIDVDEIAEDGRRDVRHYADVYWPAAAVLALLLAWEAWELTREMPRNRRGHDGAERDRRRSGSGSGPGSGSGSGADTGSSAGDGARKVGAL